MILLEQSMIEFSKNINYIDKVIYKVESVLEEFANDLKKLNLSNSLIHQKPKSNEFIYELKISMGKTYKFKN